MGLAIVMPKIRRAAGTFFPNSKESKKRAVTEPTLSNPFSMTRKMSLKGLRNVLTGAKACPEDRSAGKMPENAPPVPPVKIDKASRLLGLDIRPDWQRRDLLNAPASAPALVFPNSYRDQIFNQEVPIASEREVNSTPILNETAKTLSPTKSKGSSRRPAKDEVESEGIVLGHGNLSPTKSGSYGTMGRLEVVDNNFARVASQQGIIETMDDEVQSPAGHPSFELYSPSVYAGVWENNPNVVTMVLFSALTCR